LLIVSGKHRRWFEDLLGPFLNILMRLGLQFRIVDPFAKQLIVFIETIIQIVISSLFRIVVIFKAPSVTVWKEKELFYAYTQVIRN
jgi:hypothetical protein